MNKYLQLFLKIFFVIFITICILELLTRYFWGGPIDINSQKWEKFDVDIESIVGYKCKDGVSKFTILNDSLEITCTNCGRKTSNNINCNASQPNINFYGCSFTFGHGLEDSLTFCWKLQNKLTNYKINNYGFEGYGVSQMYAQILNHIENNNNNIKVIIINYASFHDARNMALNSPKRNAYYYQKDKSTMMKICFPILYLKNEQLVLAYKKFNYKPMIPFVEELAILNFLETIILNYNDNKMKPNDISIKAFDEINKKCKIKKIKLVVNGITNDNETVMTLNKLNKLGISTSNIYVDLNDTKQLLKDNFHPNQIANNNLANNYYRYLINIVQIK